jgi:sterol desaturase/sphingolipid hydroxylase (fatty acid hydroxylase superfamily)
VAVDPVALSVPIFLLLIALEFGVARGMGRHVYGLGSLFADMGCGILTQVLWLFYGASVIATFTWVHDHALLVEIDRPWVAWTVGFVGLDFCFYWAHRASHRVNLLWASHVVHHQSEEMNFAVALRQQLTDVLLIPFYVPMAMVLPMPVGVALAAFNNIYQFWIHTQLIPKLGPLEWVLNTPSHHRVHHGMNPRYIDKNFGGTLIIWDRLFGTFADEREPVLFGTVVPLRSFDPIWATLQPWVQLVRMTYRAPRWSDKVRLWLMPPEWTPPGLTRLSDPETPETRRKWEPDLSTLIKLCLAGELALATGSTVLLLLFQDELGVGVTALAAVGIVLTLLACAALLEGRRWTRPVEERA